MYHKDCLSVSPSRGHSLTQDMKIKNSRLFFFPTTKDMVKYPQDFFLPHVQTRSSSSCSSYQHGPQQDCRWSCPVLVQGLNCWILVSFFFFTFFSLPVEACWFTDIRDYIFVHKFTTVQLFQQITEYRSDYYLNAVATRLFFLVKRSNNRFCF